MPDKMRFAPGAAFSTALDGFYYTNQMNLSCG
jgi:hypothetical protein